MTFLSRAIRLSGPVVMVGADDRYADGIIASLRRARVACVSIDSCAALSMFELTGLGAIAVDLARAMDWHACRELSDRAAAQDVPVLAVSNWVAPDGRYRRRAFELGCVAFVYKTASAEPLIEALCRISSGERYVQVTRH